MRKILICTVIGFIVGKSLIPTNKIKKKITNPFTESPYDRMDYQDNMTNFTYVHWIQVDNVQKTCDGLNDKPYSHPVLACAVFSSYFFINVCSIYSSKKLSSWTLGHEMRHCFQGHFHAIVL